MSKRGKRQEIKPGEQRVLERDLLSDKYHLRVIIPKNKYNRQRAKAEVRTILNEDCIEKEI